jgi:hypothetical protein
MYRRGPLTVACNFSDRPLELKLGGRVVSRSDPGIRHRSGRLLLPAGGAAWVTFTR